MPNDRYIDPSQDPPFQVNVNFQQASLFGLRTELMDPHVQTRIEQIQSAVIGGDYDKAQGLMALVGFTRAQRCHIQATIQQWRQDMRFPQTSEYERPGEIVAQFLTGLKPI
jgi:hypothetical protein